MGDIREEKYAEWLEKTLTEMVELKPVKIAFCAITEEESVYTSYYHCSADDIAAMVGAIQRDGMLIMGIGANAGWIRAVAADEDEDEGQGDE